MKPFALLLLLPLLLAGCAAQPQAQEVFCVEDVLPEPTAAPDYAIRFALPPDALLAASAQNGERRLYETADGSLVILAETLPGISASEAIPALTGFSAEALRPVVTERFGMREYRFAWSCAGEDGLLACSAALLDDGACCYCLQVRTREACAAETRAQRRAVLESFGLDENEGF